MQCLICKTSVTSVELTFWGEAICSDCELKIMELPVGDREYEHLVVAFRKLWQKKALSEHDRHLLGSDHF